MIISEKYSIAMCWSIERVIYQMLNLSRPSAILLSEEEQSNVEPEKTILNHRVQVGEVLRPLSSAPTLVNLCKYS